MRQLILFAIVLLMVGTVTPSYAESPTPLSWEMMGTLDYTTGDMPDSLKKLDKQLVQVTGFIVPITQGDYIDTVQEFLLVPNPLACIHVPPPPPNQMMYVKMNAPIPLDMDYRGVEIIGTLTNPQPTTNEEVFVSFELSGISAKEGDIDFEDPLMDVINAQEGSIEIPPMIELESEIISDPED